MQPGSGEEHVLYVLVFIIYLLLLFFFTFCELKLDNILICVCTLYSFPDSLGDYLMIEVQDSKAQYHGRAIVQVAAIADNPV